ncbi:MAG: hypothetical protein G3M70_10300 [Candidatus Nitronauta litoralis]|uniref:Lipoprotein n=1 Tax=Candidatus Nitronauta litoralis TaxID=2705533 RepID=A0A7T0G0C9_9BACT|nr:MAG: hypothetical protein G3M70_10300 [Candidatus Nitronauta litoralis]
MSPKSVYVGSGLCLLAMLVTLSGCGNSKNLVYRQNTVIGLEVSANPEGTSGKAVLGYDRETNAVVPKKMKSGGETAGQEAMSAVSISHVQIGFLEANCIYEAFATGDAAVNLAENKGKLHGFLQGATTNNNSGSSTNSDQSAERAIPNCTKGQYSNNEE